jgi:hypothetical protein
MIDRQMVAAEAYIVRGWKVFALAASKSPLRNCGKCYAGACPGQDKCECGNVACHGYYAATTNLDHVRAMLWRAGEGGMLAVRTGAASGVVAVDAEGTDNDEYGETGIEVLDSFATWTEGVALVPTLKAHTSGGGVHLLYKVTDGSVNSRNRILPNVDIKGEGGYIAVPPAAGRRWEDWSAILEEPGDALSAWLQTRTGSVAAGTGIGAGILSSLRTAEVIPSGQRYEFTRDLVYHLRRSGQSWDEAVAICREYHGRYAQPPVARYELPWRQVEYELTRVWARVTPEETLSFGRQAWADKMRTRG